MTPSSPARSARRLALLLIACSAAANQAQPANANAATAASDTRIDTVAAVDHMDAAPSHAGHDALSAKLGPNPATDAQASAGTRTADEAAVAAPEALIPAFIEAWNVHDVRRFEPLFTEQAIWVPVAEVRDEGRAAILQDLAVAHASWAGKTTIAPFDTPTVGRPAAGVATLFFRVRFLDGKGAPVPGIERALLLVAVQDADRWRIAAGQLTKESAAPMAAAPRQP